MTRKVLHLAGEIFVAAVLGVAAPAAHAADPVSGMVRIGFVGAESPSTAGPWVSALSQRLREQGIDIETSCESGLCGTCRTRYLEGEPEHHDYVLDDEERDEYVMICCARSKSPVLVLDR